MTEVSVETELALLKARVEADELRIVALESDAQAARERERAMLMRGIIVLGSVVTALFGIVWTVVSKKIGLQ